ncbi:MAG TPA: tetratricopeptide repeat protein [Myxococcales bacterium]|jgi:TPR repeat protein|nr:tetratricopeptide repeat protein [Myxococcales bacterium]
MRGWFGTPVMSLGIALLVGCATERVYVGPPRPRGEVAWLVTNASRPLFIEGIDGKRSSSTAERYELPPGQHSVMVRLLAVRAASRIDERAWLVFDAEPGHTYRLRDVEDAASATRGLVIDDPGPEPPSGAVVPAGALQRGCQAGSADSCVQLGAIYEHGGTELGWDESRAAQLYRQACAADHSAGCFRLASLHEAGHGVARNEAVAADLFQHLCEAGEARACTRLGLLIQEGRGRPKDERRAQGLYESTCHAGDPAGCYRLGGLARDGAGGSADYDRAVELFKKACDGGEPQGCTELGLLREYGLGGEQDEHQAAVLYDKACSGGSAMGCANLGTLYQGGLGVPRNEALALALWRKGCSRGVASACKSLERAPAPPAPAPEPGTKEKWSQVPPVGLQVRGVQVSARGEWDLLHPGFLPVVSAELLADPFSGVAAVILQGSFPPPLRLEARFHPFQWVPVRPYLGFGASVFFPVLAARAALGVDVQISQFHLFTDFALEHFFDPALSPEYEPDAALLSFGAGWRF